MSSARTLLCAAVTTALAVTGLTVTLASPAYAATACDTMTSPVYQRYNPTNRTTILTLSANEAAAAASSGYTQDQGIPFNAARAAAPGLYGARLLEKGTTGDRVYLPNPGELS